MKKNNGFVLRDVCGEKVIVGEGLDAIDFGRLISLNDTAAWLWEHADGDFTADALAQALCEEYDVSPDVARRDVGDILSQWLQLGIVA